MASFEDFKFNKQILNAIAEAGYDAPTEIQQKAITPILAGQDVMGIAQTGTGKTAAFVLPLLMKLKYAQGNDPRALILSPTRELAMQIEEHIRLFSTYLDLRTVLLYGGLGPKTQKEQLQKGCDIIVATPGRFLELYLEGEINTKSLKFLVMDEADKMMDMGFISKIHRILEIVPRKRQNLLFSATMSELVRKISGDFLLFPTVVEVTEQATPAKTVTQSLYHVPNLKTKLNLLQHLLKDDESFHRIIVFCKTKQVADNVFHFLERKYGEDNVRVIHANKGQNTRINSINAFKEGSIRILVATDVAARGLDVSNVSHVFNFDVPIVIEDYVHRIGRTGRAFNEGDAITFANPAEEYFIGKIEKLIRQQIPVMELPEDVFVEKTGFDEKQAIAREIDNQKKKDNPDFKGAFHDKKWMIKQQESGQRKPAAKKSGGKKSGGKKPVGKKPTQRYR
ncbi:DEAD/DEAH box helicase [Sphingobacterium psychroaquaticum]|uniref:ATP-dependent RNA helicase RhlE n=1 Tax=Sphingobacterium psychroaquaticum TaxID=561061 RepID=A0A1X7L7E7_9SPHI|nr:DEAD/DEAH box helicase [Sphingobacterium psychroaquaticum]QBQ42378.1 DEAD/DEAH box helicase [Sphingobacterium psychroaquaticum]SMG49798.1 ATP-dependent RNA helicase RhlE [Sphingobacterium psychroaquaticum]